MNKLTLINLKNINSVCIKQNVGARLFLTTSDSFVISIPTLAMIIKELVKKGFMSPKVLEGILSEINDE